MKYDKEKYAELFDKYLLEGKIERTNKTFKIKLFLDKAKNSLLIAKHHKEIHT